jgi:hypothetical protein
MEKIINTFKDYDIFKGDKRSLHEIAEFIVKENYAHHLVSFTEEEVANDVAAVYQEELYLYNGLSYIYIVRNHLHDLIGCIRTVHWDRKTKLPIEKIYGINPLTFIHSEQKYSYWHIGRFVVSSNAGISTLVLFKRLVAFAVRPIIEDKYSYMIAEIDSKLLKVVNALGFITRQAGSPMNYLTSETVPVYSSKRGVNRFYSRYSRLCEVI